jgi:hypothetical protein
LWVRRHQPEDGVGAVEGLVDDIAVCVRSLYDLDALPDAGCEMIGVSCDPRTGSSLSRRFSSSGSGLPASGHWTNDEVDADSESPEQEQKEADLEESVPRRSGADESADEHDE